MSAERIGQVLFFKQVVCHVLVFGLTLIGLFIAVMLESIIRPSDYEGDWVMRRWTPWIGFALMFMYEHELRGLAMGVAAWL